jgi:hypothetical protein
VRKKNKRRTTTKQPVDWLGKLTEALDNFRNAHAALLSVAQQAEKDGVKVAFKVKNVSLTPQYSVSLEIQQSID